MNTLLLLVLGGCRNEKFDDTAVDEAPVEEEDPVPVDTGEPCELQTWYADADEDGFGDVDASTEACEAPAGTVADAGDCDDSDDQTYPDAEERCDGQDNDCDGETDEDVRELWYADTDGDGHGDPKASLEDCDPDQGFVANDADCNDDDATINPDGVELCNELDDDCDGSTDEDAADARTWHADADGDGYGDPAVSEESCEAASGWLDDDSDCDDTVFEVNPGADEVCDELDNDCDGAIDDDDPTLTDGSTWYQDADGDGWGAEAWTTAACEAPSGWVERSGDCDDGDGTASPDGTEACDEADNDCDGTVDEGVESTFYADADADGAGDAATTTEACAAPTGFVSDTSDCDDTTAAVSPWATEVCNEVDDDCDGATDEDAADASTWYADADGDGFGDPATSEAACEAASGWLADASDCDDTDLTVNPDASELCDGVDNDCDGDTDDPSALDTTRWYEDADSDGFGDASAYDDLCDQPSGSVADASDCDDTDTAVNPDASEVCDSVDNDCDGTVDSDAVDALTWYEDDDSDGFGDPDSTELACTQPTDHVADATDCDDLDGDVNPDAVELCDEVDNDCSGDVDSDAVDALTWYDDADGDGFGDAGASSTSCEAAAGTVADATDCDDGDAAVNPDATEICDGVDNDCNGDADTDATDPATWYADTDGDGFGDAASTQAACTQPSDHVADATDCDDGSAAVNTAATEVCNDLDDDCDGDADSDAVDAGTWYDDTDSDGFGDPDVATVACDAPSGTVADATDCDDTTARSYPGASEACDDADNDCDGRVDEDATDAPTWYADDDADGYGDASDTTVVCDQPSTHVSDATDCDDAEALVYPSADETCDSVDNDCDSAVDEDATDALTWYADADLDGYGDASDTLAACTEPSGYVSDATDCDDGDADVNPIATDTCDDVDNDCDDVVDEDETCAWYDCGDVLADDSGAADGNYDIDLGTGSSVTATCEMDIDGGGWTLLTSAVVDKLSSGITRRYLYTYGSGFYISPATTLVWSWSSYQALNGSYSFGTGTSISSSFSCTSSEGGSWGVGCSNGGGGTYKCLTIYSSSASIGEGTVCQDQPDVFGVGACASGAQLWYREE